jgi:hypothetical protein
MIMLAIDTLMRSARHTYNNACDDLNRCKAAAATPAMHVPLATIVNFEDAADRAYVAFKISERLPEVLGLMVDVAANPYHFDINLQVRLSEVAQELEPFIIKPTARGTPAPDAPARKSE